MLPKPVNMVFGGLWRCRNAPDLGTTSIHKNIPTHVFLPAGETGLESDSAARAEDITTVRKESLIEPHGRLRQLGNNRVCELAARVTMAMGCSDEV